MTASHEGDDAFLSGYLPYLLHRADLLLSRSFHTELQAQGVQMSEWRVLAVLGDRGPSTILELTDETMLPQPTTTHAVARLEGDGRVERRPGVLDKRQRIVSLTAEGAAVVDELRETARRCEAETMSMTRGSGAGLRRELQRLIARLESAQTPD